MQGWMRIGTPLPGQQQQQSLQQPWWWTPLSLI
jgi:hypothetical protein